MAKGTQKRKFFLLFLFFPVLTLFISNCFLSLE